MLKLSKLVAAGLGLAMCLAVPDLAQAARPKTGYVQTQPETRPPSAQRVIGPGTIIFFKRKGGHYSYGESDSRVDSNNIGQGDITPFECGDQVWGQVMACLKDSFLPYNVKITDIDPGTEEHVETVVAGGPAELGLPANVGGIAPLGCGLAYENPVAFAFSQPWGCDVNQICWAAAQETAHTFGLDHTTECTDHLTYDMRCGTVKRFRDVDKPCGESDEFPPNQQPPNPSGARQCKCTGAGKQNSHKSLMTIFGPRENGPPDVSFNRPREGNAVTKGFKIEVAIDDDFGIAHVDIYVDGTMIDSKTAAPFTTTAPATLADGPHTVTAKAIDQGGLETDVTVNVKVQPPCMGNDSCPSGTVCQMGECVDGPGTPGGLGATCTNGADCHSGICAPGPGGSKCTEVCDPAANSCPDGFDCLSAGAQNACWPGADVLNPPTKEDGGCGCTVAGASRRAPILGFLFGFAFFGLALRRRSRR